MASLESDATAIRELQPFNLGNTVDPHSIVVGRIGARDRSVHVVRDPPARRATRSSGETRVSSTSRSLTPIAPRRERRAALAAAAVIGWLDVTESVA
jgi:hypothetical protein